MLFFFNLSTQQQQLIIVRSGVLLLRLSNDREISKSFISWESEECVMKRALKIYDSLFSFLERNSASYNYNLGAFLVAQW